MRITYIGPFGIRPKGTASARMLPIAREMAARGHSVRIILPPYDHPSDSGRQWREGQVHIQNAMLPRRGLISHHAVLALRVHRAALHTSPDVLHLFKPKGYGGLACQSLLRMPRGHRPAVLVDADDWEGAGGWNDLGGYPRSWQRLFAWQERDLLCRADGVTVASRVLCRLATALRESDQRIWRAPNGCDPAAISLPTIDEATVLIFSRLHDLEPSVIVPALSAILRERPDVRIQIAGGQLHGEEARWIASLKAAGIADEVRFLGWIEPSQLPTVFQRSTVALAPIADTLINRSRCSAKLALLLSYGLPVVATAVGENATYIRTYKDGLLVAPGNAMELAQATLQLLGSPDLRERLSASAARRMREQFPWARIADTVERAYQTCS